MRLDQRPLKFSFKVSGLADALERRAHDIRDQPIDAP